ncbi:hypothetical protein BELL_0017g00080 [Botrytis elliptica]|uniref:Uncharacterized protein n=1 Tax=Botrytis elliptica TaxID=278938 RepID=A0A4Z1KFQ2_9HELO|nr:hypothetical protein BELL_0017g00080 [Botrytis elliptica]
MPVNNTNSSTRSAPKEKNPKTKSTKSTNAGEKLEKNPKIKLHKTENAGESKQKADNQWLLKVDERSRLKFPNGSDGKPILSLLRREFPRFRYREEMFEPGTSQKSSLQKLLITQAVIWFAAQYLEILNFTARLLMEGVCRFMQLEIRLYPGGSKTVLENVLASGYIPTNMFQGKDR